MNRRDEEAAEGCLYIILFAIFLLFVGWFLNSIREDHQDKKEETK